jgi:arylsulfatase A-like enzyme
MFPPKILLSLLVTAGSTCFSAALVVPADAKSTSSAPNVIVYLTDDFDFNEIGAFDPLKYPGWQAARAAGVLNEKKSDYGEFSTRPLTPHLDKLIAEGVNFTQFRIASPMCVPSRYAMLTGQFPSRATGWSKAEQQKNPRLRSPGPGLHLEAGQWQLAQAFKAAGYSTGLIGKWHLANWHDSPGKIKPPFADHTRKTVRPGSPEDAAVAAQIRTSYEAAQRHLRETQAFDTVEAFYIGNTNELGLPLALWEHSETSVEWITDHALRFLEANRAKPFFLWVAPNAPHGMAGQGFMRNSPRDTAAGRLPEDPVGMPGRDSLKQRILGSKTDPATTVSTWIDDSVGAILQRLEKLGLAENTIVVFSSDHQSYSKWTCYDGARVPFVVRWKGRTPVGRTVDTPVSAVDLAPTLLELCGLPPPSAKVVFDGRSLAAALTAPHAKLAEQPVFVEFGFGRSIVEGGWKYVALRFPPAVQARREQSGKMPRYHGEFGDSERESLGFPSYGDADQLFDLRNDMLEQRNLAADPAHAARLADLKAKLKAKLGQIGLPFGEFVPDRSVTAAR